MAFAPSPCCCLHMLKETTSLRSELFHEHSLSVFAPLYPHETSTPKISEGPTSEVGANDATLWELTLFWKYQLINGELPASLLGPGRLLRALHVAPTARPELCLLVSWGRHAARAPRLHHYLELSNAEWFLVPGPVCFSPRGTNCFQEASCIISVSQWESLEEAVVAKRADVSEVCISSSGDLLKSVKDLYR